MKILHITPHLGGGVGSTILGLLSENKQQHEVLALGYTFDYVLDKLEELNIPYTDHVKYEEILEKIPEFDIILIHQWNHPLLYDFLVRNELPPCRVIMWGHNSGFHPPNIYTKKILEYPDIFVFTTPLSYKTEEVKKLKDSIKMYDIWSTDGVEEYKEINRKTHKEFIVGYIGTVDYAKLHPNFLQMCNKIIEKIPTVRFIVIGGLKQREIQSEAIKMNIASYFEFPGFIPKNMFKMYLEIFDVFGYPLAPYHYGTCDLVLQIAMGAGIPPIVFNNPMESYMIKDKKTGIIVKNEDKYIQAVVDMYNNINWRKQIGENARQEAINRFTLKNLNSEWEKIFNIILKEPKTIKKWDIDKEIITYSDVFLESIGNYAKVFVTEKDTLSVMEQVVKKTEEEKQEIITTLKKIGTKKIREISKEPSWQTDTKGSVHNYHSYFPIDQNLYRWSELMKSSQDLKE